MQVACSVHDSAVLVAAVQAVTTDAPVLVRGGGDAAEFAVFENPDLLAALASCPSYRGLGLGHTANRTLAELVVDHAASTTTAAGEHMRRGIAAASRSSRAEGQTRELHDALAEKDRLLALASRPAPQEPMDAEPPIVLPTSTRSGLRWTRVRWLTLGAGLAWALSRLV